MDPPPPFRGLAPYTESDDDADLFFGREVEIEIASANLLAARLTLLYGPSGVGKTSLVRAGIVHGLRRGAQAAAANGGGRRQAVVLLDEWRADPSAILARRMREAGSAGELLLVLDQFEEYLTSRSVGDPFDERLAELLQSRSPPARILISLREDALAALDRFKGEIPGLFDNVLRLDQLARPAALEAIHRPLERYAARAQAPVTIEPGLAEAVLDELAAGDVGLVRRGTAVRARRDERVAPAYLQLVMARLWQAEAGLGSHVLRRSTLDALGGAHQIVQTHLRTTMDALDPRDQRLAYRLLHLLVTPSGMKVRHTAGDLAAYVEAPEADVERTLQELSRPERRILRAAPPPVDSDATVAYEIFHDVLAGAVLDWRTDYQARARARLEQRTQRLRAALVAVSAAALALAIYLWNPGLVRRADLATYDARLAVRGSRSAPAALRLVAVDDRTLRRRADPRTGRIPRTDYGALLRRLAADRPRVIVLDVIFRTRGDPRDDRALLAALRATRRRVVVAYDGFTITRGPNGDPVSRADVLDAPGTLERLGVRTGYAGLPDDMDGRIRRVDTLVATTADVDLPTLAFAAADRASGGRLARRADDLVAASRRAWGQQGNRTAWIDFRGGPGTVRRVSALDVLRGRTPRGAFRDGLVVIGVTASGTPDVHRTPVDDGSRPLAGPELQAEALDTLLRGAPLRDVPPVVDLLALAVLACVAPVLALVRSTGAVAVGALVAAVLFLAVAQALFQAGRVIAVVVPLTALAAATAGVLGVAAARALRLRTAHGRRELAGDGFES
jgi:CHASE2 domain-containing sensor protein